MSKPHPKVVVIVALLLLLDLLLKKVPVLFLPFSPM